MKDRVMGRVVFYSASDLSVGGHLQDAEPILRKFDADTQRDINDVLELYGIKKYIDAGCALRVWTEAGIQTFKATVEQFPAVVTTCFRRLESGNIESEYQKVDDELKSTFWEIFTMYKVYERVDSQVIKQMLETGMCDVDELLIYKPLVDAYDDVLAETMRGKAVFAQLILSAYLLELDSPEKRPNIPASLTLDDKEAILSEFIGSASPNVSLLRIIEQSRDSNQLRLQPETRLKAKRKADVLYGEMMKDASTFAYSVRLELMESDKDWGVKLVSDSRNNYRLCYNEKVLRAFDDERLVTMFADAYGFLDKNMLMTMPFNYITDSVMLEMLSGYHGKKDYPVTSVFNFKQRMAVMQMAFHRQYLKGRGKRIEELLMWFYNDLLKNKYGYPSGAISLGQENASEVDKIRVLIPEIDAILKRYDLYANKGVVDEELLGFYQGVHITDTRSVLKRKYFYPVEGNTEVFTSIRLLFHSGSLLDKLPDGYKGERNLFNTVRHSKVRYDQYREWQRQQLDFLIDKGLIKVDTDGYLCFANEERIAGLYDLHHDRVIYYWGHPQCVRDEIDKMEAEGLLYSEQKLFSKPEKDYMNYLLNDKQFTNGPAFRNTYAHGEQPNVDARVNETAYNYLLIVLVCTLLKILSELILKSKKDNDNN